MAGRRKEGSFDGFLLQIELKKATSQALLPDWEEKCLVLVSAVMCGRKGARLFIAALQGGTLLKARGIGRREKETV